MYNANNTFGLYHIKARLTARKAFRKAAVLNDGSVSRKILLKIQWYMAGSVVMGEMISSLNGKRLSRSDRNSLIYLGAVMALFDVLTDEIRTDRRILEKILLDTLVENPDFSGKNTSPAVRICYMFLDELHSSTDSEQWNAICSLGGLIKKQIQSDEQFNPDLEESDAEELTEKKAGAALMLCSTILRIKDPEFVKAIYETGSFIQRLNDTQDMYCDTVSGIRTFVHFCDGFDQIRSKLLDHKIKIFEIIRSLDIPESNKYKFLFDLNAMFVVISYKLNCYECICASRLDFGEISKMEKEHFRINPFSLKSIRTCSNKILDFGINEP